MKVNDLLSWHDIRFYSNTYHEGVMEMRINNSLGLVLATGTALMLSGCVIAVNDGDSFDWNSTEQENRAQLEKLTVGMSTETVLALMGTADFNELQQREEHTIQVLYFRTHHRHSDGDTTKDECTPVVFKDGKVTGWGEAALLSNAQL